MGQNYCGIIETRIISREFVRDIVTPANILGNEEGPGVVCEDLLTAISMREVQIRC